MGAPGEGPAVGVTGPAGPAVEGTPSCGDIGVNGDMGRCMANELTYGQPKHSTLMQASKNGDECSYLPLD